jgi:RNA polymerase sigma factor (sigma-70 family)
MTDADHPEPRFPFIARALKDHTAAERLGALLSEGSPAGMSEKEVLSRIYDELLAKATRILNRSFRSLRHRVDAHDLVKSFSMNIHPSMVLRHDGVTTKEQFFAAAATRFCGFLKDELRRHVRHDAAIPNIPRRNTSPSAARDASDCELMALALEAVERLPPGDRELFEERIAGKSYEQLGATHQISTASAQQRCERITAAIEAEAERLARHDGTE